MHSKYSPLQNKQSLFNPYIIAGIAYSIGVYSSNESKINIINPYIIAGIAYSIGV